MCAAEGTIYPILNRLKVGKMVIAHWAESESGPPRRYYKLTKAGRGRAKAIALIWREFSANMGKFIAPIADEGELDEARRG